MGHAHTLVLCEGPVGRNTTELYVFGSNNFGQLGLSITKPESEQATSPTTDDGINYSGQVKYLLPQRLEIAGASRIRLIHTKFFTNVSIRFLFLYL